MRKMKKGDTVVVITGRDKGKSGKVLGVNPKAGVVLVEKINIVKKHMKPTQKTQGGIIELEKALPLSKVMVQCPHCGKASRIGIASKDGSAKRLCKKCSKTID